MLITTEMLASFSGVIRDEENEQAIELQKIYIGSATNIINNYLGCDVESYYEAKDETIPELIKLVCLEIATLIQMEESGNLGVNNSAEIGGITRNFLNVVNYDKYLKRLAVYKVGDTLET